MSAVPPAIPVTIPLPEPIVATTVLSLLQVPPGDASVNGVVVPEQRVVVPVIEKGNGLTVIAVEVLQPVAKA